MRRSLGSRRPADRRERDGAGQAQHGRFPAVESWFGKAIQVCPQGMAPSACAGGEPANALFMTPTLTAEGLFIGNDSFTLLSAPFGPHTTAHGSWTPTSSTEFTAEYVFMTITYPPEARTISGYRFRWAAEGINANTAVGYQPLHPACRSGHVDAAPVQRVPRLSGRSGRVRDTTRGRRQGSHVVPDQRVSVGVQVHDQTGHEVGGSILASVGGGWPRAARRPPFRIFPATDRRFARCRPRVSGAGGNAQRACR